MRAKVNENNTMTITELYHECHVNSVIAMAIDYATSFTVFRHETSTHIDVSFGWLGEENYEAYQIELMCSGSVLIYETTNGWDVNEREEYDSYEDAFERLVNIFAGTDLNTK